MGNWNVKGAKSLEEYQNDFFEFINNGNTQRIKNFYENYMQKIDLLIFRDKNLQNCLHLVFIIRQLYMVCSL